PRSGRGRRGRTNCRSRNGDTRASRALRADAIAEPLLQLGELALDAGIGLELGELVGDRLLAPEIIDLDLALELVERALDLLEAGERVADPLVIELRAHLEARRGALLPGRDRLLARFGVFQLRLELGDILVLFRQRRLDLGEL